VTDPKLALGILEAPAGVLVVTEGHSSKIPRASLGSVTVATCEE